MDSNNETWLIDEGDRIIQKKSSEGCEALSDIEKAAYYFWVIDYAVRNSGTLQPMSQMNKNSAYELLKFAQENECNQLSSLIELARDEKAFCENYYENFDRACEDLRYFEKNRK